MKVYLEPEEVVNMEKAAGNLRDRILIHILFRLGCQVSEALGLTVEDVYLAKDTDHKAPQEPAKAVMHHLRAKTRQKTYILSQVWSKD
jgi:site-specific recombinase XerD